MVKGKFAAARGWFATFDAKGASWQSQLPRGNFTGLDRIAKYKMPLLGYGEDQLTLWALTTARSQFLTALDDPTPPQEATVFFRPSFGRNSTRAKGSKRSEFGEFDAIVVTHNSVYLVEAKWSTSAELEDRVIRLQPEQRHRHEVLRWYFDTWSSMAPPDWHTFAYENGPTFRRAFPTMVMPSASTALARNLEFLLRRATDTPRRLVDVILFTAVSGVPLPDAVDPSDFELVALRCSSIGGAGYVVVQDA